MSSQMVIEAAWSSACRKNSTPRSPGCLWSIGRHRSRSKRRYSSRRAGSTFVRQIRKITTPPPPHRLGRVVSELAGHRLRLMGNASEDSCDARDLPAPPVFVTRFPAFTQGTVETTVRRFPLQILLAAPQLRVAICPSHPSYRLPGNRASTPQIG